MIGIWASAADTSASAVGAVLRSRGNEIIFIDDERTTTAGQGRLDVAGRQVELSRLRALYLRSNNAVPTELWWFADEAEIPVVNRPSAGITNASKPFQSRLISAAGFGVPDTLITTSVPSARHFIARHRGDVIYKSISSVRSIVSKWTLDDDARINSLNACPTQLQERIPPPDMRVHVVGSEVFGCMVWSEADDYRFASRLGVSVEMAETTVPSEVERRLVPLVASMGLGLAGADFRRRANGQWCCLEVNPSPAFTFYEPTADKVAEAIARRLEE